MVYLNTHTQDLDFESALARVSSQRRAAALRYLRDGDRRLSLAVYLLLQEALEKEYGITGAPDFAFGEYGKPFLRDYPNIHFNLSHCPGAALCVVADSPVGCDVERVPVSLDMDLCRQVCCESELAGILASPSPAAAFTALWTRKEALLKYTGEGIAGVGAVGAGGGGGVGSVGGGAGGGAGGVSGCGGEGVAGTLRRLLFSPLAREVVFETVSLPSDNCVYTVCRGANMAG